MENWSGEWASRQKKDKTERATGLGRRTREEIVKWNQMTALRFQSNEVTCNLNSESDYYA